MTIMMMMMIIIIISSSSSSSSIIIIISYVYIYIYIYTGRDSLPAGAWDRNASRWPRKGGHLKGDPMVTSRGNKD